jgi:hypothetical protein
MSEALGGPGAARIAYICPLLSPAEAASIDERDRARLYARALQDLALIPIDRLITILTTVAQISDVRAARLVDALLRTDDVRPGADDLRRLAESVREQLATRARYERESRSLLRAAQRPPEADRLLRAAPGAPGVDAGRLLRPASRFDDEPAPAPLVDES